MTSTSQKSESDPKPGASPEQGADHGNAKQVPLGEHIELRQQHRTLADENAQLKAQLAAMNKPPASAAPDQGLAETVRDLSRRQRLTDLSSELGTSTKQTQAIAELIEKTPGLSAIEAKSLATMRSPDLFKDDADQFLPGTHGSARPGVGIPTPHVDRDETEDRINFILSQKQNRNRQDRLFDNLIGHIAAEDVGMPGHQMIPLPQQR